MPKTKKSFPFLILVIKHQAVMKFERRRCLAGSMLFNSPDLHVHAQMAEASMGLRRGIEIDT
jgi:hypothetical protein